MNRPEFVITILSDISDYVKILHRPSNASYSGYIGRKSFRYLSVLISKRANGKVWTLLHRKKFTLNIERKLYDTIAN